VVVGNFVPLDGDQFEAFCWYHFLDTYIKHPIGEFHQELLRLIKYQYVAVAAPRSFAKSTYFSVLYPLFAALERPGSVILLVSASWDLATGWIGKIRKELETNTSLLEMYGDQAPKARSTETGRWTNDELHLKNGSVLRARGAGQQIRGFRPTIVVVDDLETDEVVANADRLKDLGDWFKSALLGTLFSDGQMLFVGTLLHPESLLAHYVHEPPPGWVSRLYRADGEDGRTPLWPEEWPLEKLAARRAQMENDYLYEQEYRNNPIPDERRVFRRIEHYDELPGGLLFFTAVDPAISLAGSADYTAIVTVGVDADHNFYVAETINKRLLPDKVVEQIFKTYDKWRPICVGVEATGFQRMLKHEIELQRLKRNVYFPVPELKSGGRSKHLRIEALQPRFEAGKVFLHRGQEELKTQLLRYPSRSGHDDLLDALAYILDIYRPADSSRGRGRWTNPLSIAALVEEGRRLGRMNERRDGGVAWNEAPRFWGNDKIFNGRV
jgi:predicted phage terminase large subunit-like protein